MATILHSPTLTPDYWYATPQDIAERILAQHATADSINTELRSILCIVPTSRLQRHAQKALADLQARRGIACHNLRITTITALAKECSKSLNLSVRLISEGYRLAKLDDLATKATLGYFKQGQKSLSPAVLEKLYSILHGLRKKGITPQNFEHNLQSGVITNRHKAQDLHVLFSAYCDALDYDLTDETGLFMRLCAQEHSSYKTPLLNHIETILFVGFSEFHLPEIHFIKHLQQQYNIEVHIDYSEKNGPLFGALKETIDQLSAIGLSATRVNDKDSDTTKNSSVQDFLRRWLFNTERHIRHSALAQHTRIYSYFDRTAEVRGIMKHLKHLILEKHINPNDICVITQNPSDYTPLFREFSALYHIPANITDRYALDTSGITIAIFSVLTMISRAYKRDDVRRVMMNPYISLPKHSDGTLIDVNNLFLVAERLRIVGGNRQGKEGESWLSIMKSRKESLHRYHDELQQSIALDTTAIEECREEIERIELAQKDFELFLENIRGIQPKTSLTADEFQAFVSTNIVQHFAIKENIVAYYQQLVQRAQQAYSTTDSLVRSDMMLLRHEIEKDTRALATFLKVLQELTVILNTIESTRTSRGFAVYIDKLQTMCSQTRFQVLQQPIAQVTFTTPEQIRNIPFQIIIMCGMIHGEFPARYTPESFLGIELLDSEDRFMKRERMAFYQALSNNPTSYADGTRQMILTYPSHIEDMECTRSYFLDALLKVSCTQEEESQMVTHIPSESFAFAPLDHTQSVIFPLWHNVPATTEEYMRSILHRFVENATDIDSTAHSTMWSALVAPTMADILPLLQKQLTVLYKRQKRQHHIVTLDVLPPTESNSSPTKAYSVSTLEQYAACPYQWYAQSVLRLQSKEEYDNALTPAESGSLLHLIAYRFYTNLQQQSTEPILPGNIQQAPPIQAVQLYQERRDEYAQQLLSIATDALERIRYDHPFFQLDEDELIGRQSPDTERKLGGKLLAWLDGELTRSSSTTLKPSGFEINFTGRSRSVEQNTLPPIQLTDKLFLQGKIDRVDIDYKENQIQFAIIDYKKGKASAQPKAKDILHGTALQMPLYAVAMQKILADTYNTPSALLMYARYISFTLEKDKEGAKTLATQDVLQQIKPKNARAFKEQEELLGHALKVANDIINNIEQRNFSITPHEKKDPCQYCSFSAVCRIKEIESMQ